METQPDEIDESFRIPDEMWERIRPLLPVEPPKPQGGHPRNDDREMMDGIFYVLRTGIQWKALPRHIGAGSSVHDRFQEWQRASVFRKMWEAGLMEYDSAKGIEWEWQAMDGAMTKAPLGGEGTGPNPTDRSKSGTKRSVLTDGQGVPLGVAVDGANRNDMKMVRATLEAQAAERPKPTKKKPQNMCLDKGYDFDEVRDILAEFGYTPHIRARGEEAKAKKNVPGYRARRWVVERTHSWMNRFRRLLIRWEKKVENYLAMLEFACAFIAFRAAEVFG
jgi:transposase